MAERFNQRVQITPQNTSSGAASGLMSLGNQFQQFSQQAFQRNEQKITEEGIEEGRSAFVEGEKPEFKEERFIGGVRAKAFNKGLAHSYKASLANDMRSDLADITRDNPDDVEAYDQQVAGLKASISEIDPIAQNDVRDRFDAAETGHRIRVQDQQAQKLRKEQEDVSAAHFETVANAAMTHARAGENKLAADAIIEGREAIEEMVGAELISPTVAADMTREIERLATQESWKGKFEREANAKGLPQAFKSLEKLSTKPPAGLTQPEWDGLRGDIQQILTRKRSISNANRAARSTEAVDALRSYSKAVTLGMDVDPEETAQVQKLVSGIPELQKQFGIINDVKSYALLSTAERQNILMAAKTGKLEDVDQYAATIKAEMQIQKAIKTDAYHFGVQQGLIENIPFSPESYPQKREQAKFLTQHYGTDVSPMSSLEVTAIVDKLPTMTTDERISLALTFKDTPMVWDQLNKKQAGTFAQAGATGDVNVMKVIFTGQDALKAKTAKAPNSVDYLADFHDYVGQAYQPKDAGNVLEAAKAYYAGIDPSGIYDANNFEKALDAVTGGMVKINGVKVELPRGVDDDDFESFVTDIQPETVRESGGVVGKTDEEAARIISESILRGTKDGYLVDSGGNLLYSGPGQPFILKYTDEAAAKNTAFLEADEKVKRDAVREKRATRAERKQAATPTPYKDFFELLKGNVPERAK